MEKLVHCHSPLSYVQVTLWLSFCLPPVFISWTLSVANPNHLDRFFYDSRTNFLDSQEKQTLQSHTQDTQTQIKNSWITRLFYAATGTATRLARVFKVTCTIRLSVHSWKMLFHAAFTILKTFLYDANIIVMWLVEKE